MLLDEVQQVTFYGNNIVVSDNKGDEVLFLKPTMI